MDRGQADILVSDLAREMALDTLALDENGMCILSLDGGKLIITIGHNRAAGSIDFMASLDAVDPTPARVAEALMANYDNGASRPIFAAEPDTGTLVLQQRYLEFGDAGPAAAMASFVEDVESWIERLSAVASVEANGDQHQPGVGVRA